MIRLSNRERLYAYFQPNRIGVEIGVHVGNNAESLLRIARPETLVLIDPWRADWLLYDGSDVGIPGGDAWDAVRGRFAAEIAVGTVLLERGCGREVLEQYPDAYFAWAYLDASHDYEETARELEVLSRKVSPLGIIAGHDYCDEFPGVPRAVNEFVAATDWRLAFLTDFTNERWPSFGLRKT